MSNRVEVVVKFKCGHCFLAHLLPENIETVKRACVADECDDCRYERDFGDAAVSSVE